MPVLTYLFAVLAAVANAVSSVLQRKADREEPSQDNLSLRLILDLLHKPVWFLGVLGVIAGFLLQAAALSTGPLAAVEPILIIELPVTLLLAGTVFGQPLHAREWSAAAAMTVGLAGLLYLLAPSGGSGADVSGVVWGLGIAANLGMIVALVTLARRGSGMRRASLLGVATGAAFGLTAALMTAMTAAFSAGFLSIFSTWQTYAMVAVGGLAMFLLQSALNAGSLVAAQPGFTATDPVVSVVWGVVVFGENVRSGVYYLGSAVVAAALVGWGVYQLSHSPLVTGDSDPSKQSQGAADLAGRRSGKPEPATPAAIGDEQPQ